LPTPTPANTKARPRWPHTKFGQRALCKVLDISQIHVVVTDERTPSADLALSEDRGCKVLVAGSSQAVPVAAGPAV
jgi:hypothetical protein